MGKRVVCAIGVVCGLVGCTPVSYWGDDYGSAETLPERARDSSAAEPTSGDAEHGVRPSSRALDGGVADASVPCDDGGCSPSLDASTLKPVTQTFTLGPSDCGGGQCGGGYDDEKDAKLLPTATKQCIDRGFARATDFTIGGQPGGRFCSYSGTAYGCDSSCDGCNVMKTITCVTP